MSESVRDDWWMELVEQTGQIASELGTAPPGRRDDRLASIADADIATLVFLVLLQAARSAEEDLKAILDEVRDLNRRKQRLRELLDKLRKSEVDAAVDAMKDELDSLSELSEEEALRLQLAMDRLAKLESTISNILKKFSDTAASIIANLK